jgi:hypothetical protein
LRSDPPRNQPAKPAENPRFNAKINLVQVAHVFLPPQACVIQFPAAETKENERRAFSLTWPLRKSPAKA